MKNTYPTFSPGSFIKTSLVLGLLLWGSATESYADDFLKEKRTEAKQHVKTSNTNARMAATASVPLNSDNYSPNSPTGSWVLDSRSKYLYNAQGRKVSEIKRDATTNQPIQKDSAGYDMHGNETFYANYYWMNNAWDMSNGYKSNFTYNPNGTPSEEISQQYSNGVWTNTWRDVSTYNAAGKLVEEITYEWLNGAWVPEEKYTLTYNAAGLLQNEQESVWVNNAWEPDYRVTYNYQGAATAPFEVIEQEYTNGVWVNEERMTNITWRNFNNWETLAYTEQGWVNNAWENEEQTTTVYDAFGGYVETDKVWMNNAWVNGWRYSESYDSRKNWTGYKSEEWLNNAWTVNSETQYQHTYNATDDITETIIRYWDSQNNTMRNAERRVFSNFLRISGTSAERPELVASLYPNPTTDYLNIELKEQAPATATLHDLTGRLVRSEMLPAGQTRVDVSALKAGIYLLQVQNKKGTFTTRIVKQ